MIEDLAGEFTDVDDFEAFIEQARHWVGKVFEDFDAEDDDLPAAAIFQDAAGTVAICPISHFMQSEESKEAISQLLPKVAQMTNACRYLFASSAWSVETIENEEELREYQRTHDSLQEHPDCIEVAQMFLGEWTGETAFLTARIIRHRGMPPTLGEWRELRSNWLNPEVAGHTGRFADPVMFQLTGMQSMAMAAVDSIAADEEMRDKFWEVVAEIATEKGYTDPNQMELPEPNTEEGRELFERITTLMEERHPGEMEKVRARLRETVMRTRQPEKDA